ncbi:MAG: carbon monoxide dehydrogenase, partial [Planctomycetota bacterium]
MSAVVKEDTKPTGNDNSVCEATIEMLKYVSDGKYDTAFQRAQKVKPCPIGEVGSCCKHCAMGPCRFNPKKPDDTVGVCGADNRTVAARNFCRMIAAGTAAHCEHSRHVTHTFIAAAKGEVPGYKIQDTVKLNKVAADFGIETRDKPANKV